MLVLLTILIAFASIALLTAFAKHRKSNLLENQPPNQFQHENLRPLFAPTEEEIRAFEREEKSRLEAKNAEDRRAELAEKSQKALDFQENWRNEPNIARTVELLFLASASENARTFSDIAETLIQFWRENRTPNIDARDLADLLDSHLRTLPQQERTSGRLFVLREEIEKLRREVRGN